MLGTLQDAAGCGVWQIAASSVCYESKDTRRLRQCLALDVRDIAGHLAAGGYRDIAHEILNLTQTPLRKLDIFECLSENPLFESGECALDIWINAVVEQLKCARDAVVFQHSGHALSPQPWCVV